MTANQYASRRKSLGLSHQEMADELGIDRGTSRRYEKGEIVIPKVVVLALDFLKLKAKEAA